MSVHTTSREAREDRRYYQARTAAKAVNIAAPWTQEDDRELLTGPGTVAQRAARLGRTYYAANARLSFLRHGRPKR
jgi:hypothetical protein